MWRSSGRRSGECILYHTTFREVCCGRQGLLNGHWDETRVEIENNGTKKMVGSSKKIWRVNQGKLWREEKKQAVKLEVKLEVL